MGRNDDGGHVPVMLGECVRSLDIKPGGVYVDCTLGRGGHSRAILEVLGPSGKLIAIDRDTQAVEYAGELFNGYGDKIIIKHGNFADLNVILDDLDIGQVDGILFDLGVSSPQLDDARRGFSYMQDAPLDMRMDRGGTVSAYDIVNYTDAGRLADILRDYGEERYAVRIAAAICRERDVKPVETTLRLVDIIVDAMPAPAKREKQHPAKRSFQAIRIAVNDELEAVRAGLEKAIARLAPGGRVSVITFHSLEDRIVKQTMKNGAEGCVCPPEFPVCVCGRTAGLKIIKPFPAIPGEGEIERNPRARSAKLRTAQKL